MSKYIYFNAVAICLVITSIVKSQPATPNPSDFSKMTEVLPPSPNAASLGKYGGIDLSLASGMANINIPLYQYNSINVQTPISLSYTSNGFRVDELPGRVGTGWSLNAGGVITRTVYGNMDERSTRLSPPTDFPARSRALVDFMDGLSLSHNDAQPDLFAFNFNGYTGRFILDKDMKPVLLSHSGLKIETDSIFTDGWNFKITTTDGVKYFFGGSAEKETTNKSITGTGCGRIYPRPAITAWYLNKIVHPNNDSILFTYAPVGMSYTTSISESVYARANRFLPLCGGGGTVSSPILNNASCKNEVQISGLLLQEINSTSGAKVKFIYTNRKDCGDKLLSSIEIYHPNQVTPYKLFDLSYNYAQATNFTNSYSTVSSSLTYRPFLMIIIEKTADSKLSKKHAFAYNDINSLPPRLSYAQDHYGYFNGQNNNTLIPLPSLSWQDALPSATANREVNPLYCQKGLLSSITYPTGGKDSIIYEANQIYQRVAIYPPKVSIEATASNTTGRSTTVYSDSAIVSFTQTTRITGYCGSRSTTGGDPIHDQTSVTFTRDGTTIFTTTVKPGKWFDEKIDLIPGIYQIEVTTSGKEVSGGATLYYQSGVITYQDKNVNTGGVRVAKTISYDSISNNATIKKYLYSTLSTPDISSAGSVFVSPQYEKYLKVYLPCSGALPSCDVVSVDFYSCYSNTLNNLYVYPASPVSYKNVIESFGDNFENGCIEHQFTVYKDKPAYSLVGDGTLLSGAPLSSYAWKNAQEIYQHTFKKIGTEFIPVKKIFTSYKEDVRVDQDIKAYLVNKKYSAPCTSGGIPFDEEINAYDLLTYSHFQKWVYPDTIRTWTYDDNGRNYVEQINITEYANAAHALPTKQTTFSSKGIKTKLTTLYPQDTTLSGTEEVVRKALISKNMIGNILQQKINNGDSLLYTLKTGYAIFPNGLILPQTHTISINNKSTEERNRFYTYNNYGKIIEQSKTGDIHKVYIWGYKNQYPVAEIIGSTDSIVSKLINQTIVDNPTSDQQLRDELHKIRTGLATSKVLVTTYTYNPGIGITSQTDPNNKTIYYEYDQLGRLKRIKDQNKNILKKYDYQYQLVCNPETSRIFTKNDCSVGYTGSAVVYTIPENKYCATNATELATKINNDFNTNGQAYANANGSCTVIPKIYNVAMSKTFTKNNCAISASVGSDVVYIVPVGKYFSYISQEDANSKAQADIEANGQNYANTNGACNTTYVKLKYENIVYSSPNLKEADIVLKFYKDSACTIPITVNNLPINYILRESNKYGSSEDPYVQVCNGSTTYIDKGAVIYQRSPHSDNWYRYDYFLAPGSNYVPR